MSAGIVVFLLIAAATVVFVIAPLMRADAAEAERVSSAISEERDLRSRHDMLVSALKDLEDDRATGKVDENDHARLKAELSAEAIQIMRQLDALDEARATSSPVAVPGEAVDSPEQRA